MGPISLLIMRDDACDNIMIWKEIFTYIRYILGILSILENMINK